MTDRSSIVEGGHRPTQGADFAMLPALARRLGVSFDDTRPPRHLGLHGAGGVRLHALDWGGEGPPALFLHGGRRAAPTSGFLWPALPGPRPPAAPPSGRPAATAPAAGFTPAAP